MFGKNDKLTFRHRDTGASLLVREVFATIQGEGPMTGWPAVFLRLGGCPLSCWFCDTDFDQQESTWTEAGVLANVIAAEWENQLWPDESRFVVITGGEPFAQDLTPLIYELKDRGFTVQIETSGVGMPGPSEPHWWKNGWATVVCSPKTGSVWKPLLWERTPCPVYWKYIIGAEMDLAADGLPLSSTQQRDHDKTVLLQRPPLESMQAGRVYVQPLYEYLDEAELKPNTLQNHRNEQTVRNVALSNGYRVSMQIHKQLGVE